MSKPMTPKERELAAVKLQAAIAQDFGQTVRDIAERAIGVLPIGRDRSVLLKELDAAISKAQRESKAAVKVGSR